MKRLASLFSQALLGVAFVLFLVSGCGTESSDYNGPSNDEMNASESADVSDVAVTDEASVETVEDASTMPVTDVEGTEEATEEAAETEATGMGEVIVDYGIVPVESTETTETVEPAETEESTANEN